MVTEGTLRYSYEAGEHGKGGDPTGGFVEIDTNHDVLRVKQKDTGIARAIGLDDLYDLIGQQRDKGRGDG